MPEILKPTQFGNPILRTPARKLSRDDIVSPEIRELITNMLYTLEKKEYGVGLAAPQVGEGVSLAVLGIKPTKLRPDRARFEMILINPVIIDYYGRRSGLWEGCISEGSSRAGLFAKALRYRKIRLQWLNESAEPREQDFEGLEAHVIQHEVDHLNGILFVDRVRDTASYMTSSEYHKRIVRPHMEKLESKRRKAKK